MYCVIQEIRRKKPNPYGEPLEIKAYQNPWRLDESKPYTWAYEYSGERYARPHLEAYKISIHHSYRENGVVRKHQYSIRTMSYYDIVEYSLYDCADSSITATAGKLGIDPAELYELIETKLEPLRERLEADFHQSAEYKAKQEHQRILEAHRAAQAAFCKRYGVDTDDYDRCYDVFGALRNKDYLAKIKAEHKARKQAERDARKRSRESWRSYQDQWRSTYGGQSSGSYSIPSASTYTAEETAILKQFYRSLSKTYHPDLNPSRDTTAEMQLLNKLKETWGV